MEDYERWLDGAEMSVREAKGIIKLGYNNTVSFKCNQAAEFALKALQIHRYKTITYKRLDRAHELTVLAARLDAPANIIRACAELNPYYVISRHPNVKVEISGSKAEHLIELSEDVVKWSKSQTEK